MDKGFLVLEDGSYFEGLFLAGSGRAGELVFNTAHFGYEEIATDPSYYNQIMIMTSPMMGNYGVDENVWESRRYWINGFAALEIQNSCRDKSWLENLNRFDIPVLMGFDTRKLVTLIRDVGTPWGAVVRSDTPESAKKEALELIDKQKALGADWPFVVSTKEVEEISGVQKQGPRVAVLDFGCKRNIIRELEKRCSHIAIFPSRTSADEIRALKPDGVLLSNGPGDPSNVEGAVETIQDLLGELPIFGICMGHQLLGRALGGKTYSLKFGHRGVNHPVRDLVNDTVYMTSQNHGYALIQESLPQSVEVSHINLNDNTVSGIRCPSKKAFSVQFHPESHPGPREAESLFDEFVNGCRN